MQQANLLRAGDFARPLVPRPHAIHTLAFKGDSRVVFFPGDYLEYEVDKKKRLGKEGAKPRRIRYKPISR